MQQNTKNTIIDNSHNHVSASPNSIFEIQNDCRKEVRTPKRHLNYNPDVNNSYSLKNINDENDNDFEPVTHKRKKRQSVDKEKHYEEQNDVTMIHNYINSQPQPQLLQQKDKQKGRTITNSRMFTNKAPDKMNHRENNIENERNIKQTHLTNYSSTNNYNNHQHDDKYKFTNSALHCAVEQHLPPIKIKCQPKIKDHKDGTLLVKEFLHFIEKKLIHINKEHTQPIGFDYWYIDRNNDLQCYTKSIALFVFLCDANNYPEKILNTMIQPNPPKYLPTQRSVIIKYVPRSIEFDEIKNEICTRFRSIFNIEEMKGATSVKSRHIRMELSDQDEYEKMIYGQSIPISGQLFEVTEFLAPPRLIICSKCNIPGHLKKECNSNIEKCKKCGSNRNEGDHKECAIVCHHCNGNHEATSYECPFINDYRKELMIKLKSRPDLLPKNCQFFIPTQFRSAERKNNHILINPKTQTQHNNDKNIQQQSYFNQYSNKEWPILSNISSLTNTTNKWYNRQQTTHNIWNDMNEAQKEIMKTHEKFKQKEIEIENQYRDMKKQLGAILSLSTTMIKQHNECLNSVINTMNEIIPMITLSIGLNKQIIENITKPNDMQEILSVIPNITQLQTWINYLHERQQLISTKYAEMIDNFEKNNNLLTHGIELLAKSSE
ncbi:unnamed protein product [Rotaria socialis]|nr:unnamed protein product [Rotaria socialis]CAF3363925.1 unnamed protein product [Rotaria socialis]CAF4525302.1 unnamed protein product [Rotaria socialis]